MDEAAEQTSEDVSPFSVPLSQINFDVSNDDVCAELPSFLPTVDCNLDSHTKATTTAITNGNGHSCLHSESSSVSTNLESKGDGNSGRMRCSSRRYVCKHCEYTTPSYSSLSGHFQHFHPRLLKNGNLLQHYKKMDSAQGKHVPMLYACQHCNYVTLSLRGFVLHSSKSHPKRKVNPLKQGSPITTATNKKYLEALYLSKYEPRKNKDKIRWLLSAHHPDSKVLEELPKYFSTDCILCGEKFKTGSLLGQHYEIRHSHQGPKKNLTTGKYHCKMCSHKSLTRLTLYKHYAGNHFMDTFYAWNVPVLESLLRQHRIRSPKKTRVRHRSKPNVLLEQPDAYLPSSIYWNKEEAAQCQTVESVVPCLVCDFSSKNFIELLAHYQNYHNRHYPRGFQMFLLQRLHLHTQAIYVSHHEAQAIDEVSGAWVDKNNQIVQYFQYTCSLCGKNYDCFESTRRHMAETHSLVEGLVGNITRNIVSSDPAPPAVFTQCTKCGFISLSHTDDEMLEHLKSLHDGSDDVVGLLMTHDAMERRCCSHCEFIGNFDSMHWHYAEKHILSFFWETLMKVESITSHASSKCCACDCTFLDEQCLIQHYETCHFQEAATFKISLSHKDYQCVLCTAVLFSKAGMARHHQRCVNKIIFKGSKAKTERLLFCKHCRKIYANVVLLWTHITQQHCPFAQLFSIEDVPECTLKFGIWDQDNSNLIENLEKALKSENNEGDLGNFSSSEGGSESDDDDDEEDADKLLSDITHSDSSHARCIRAGTNDNARMSEDEAELPDIVSVWSSASVSMRCKFCPFAASKHEALTNHLTSVHEHDLTLRCFGCEKQFSTLKDCVDHHTHMHGLGVNSDTVNNFLPNDIVAAASNGGVKYSCAWCSYKGFSRLVVLNHFNSTHILSDSRKRSRRKSESYVCKWCEHRTKNIPSMRAHLISGHGRIVSYHALMDFRTDDSDNIAGSSESSDDTHDPGKRRTKNTIFGLVQRCSIEDDSDFSDPELYQSTHIRCKHQSRYPYACRFCMNAFVCTTTFLKHCLKDHSQWCTITPKAKHVTVIPDSGAISRLAEKSATGDGFSWSCELCGIEQKSLLEVQEHVEVTHNGRKVFVCKHCNYVSVHEKSIVLHANCHTEVMAWEMNRSDEIKIVPEKACGQADNSMGRSSIASPSHVDEVISDLQARDASKNDEQYTPSRRRARKSIRSPLDEFSSPSKATVKSLLGETSKNSVAFYAQHVETIGGVIRCRKCHFTCTDAQRMKVHFDVSHSLGDAFSCKFCNYVSNDFSKLDSHLAEFHKIKRNHQLGLQVRSSLRDKHVPLSEEDKQAIEEIRSRFLYTPTPCLPILKEDVEYVNSGVTNFVGSADDDRHDQLKCSYCGFLASSTFSLEAHMRRHEGAFLDDPQKDGNFVNYKMKKMNIVSGFFSN